MVRPIVDMLEEEQALTRRWLSSHETWGNTTSLAELPLTAAAAAAAAGRRW